MPEITLGSSTLPADMQWTDEFGDGSDLVAQDERYTITGALVVQASAKQAGRRITLQGRLEGNKGFAPLTRAQVEALRELAAVPGATYTLTFSDGRAFPVMFRRDGPAVVAEPWRHVDPPLPEDLYFCRINLMQV